MEHLKFLGINYEGLNLHFLQLFIAQPAIAEFVCTSTTTAAEIFADSDKTCTTDAEVMKVTLKSGEFYNANTDNKFGSDSASVGLKSEICQEILVGQVLLIICPI